MHSLIVSYRPDNYPDWLPWREFHDQFGMIGDPSSLGTAGLPNARPGFAPRTSFGKPPDKGDSLSTKRNLRRGFNFQVRFRGRGHVVLDRFRIHAQKQTERSTAR
jgi:hypothetical protein